MARLTLASAWQAVGSGERPATTAGIRGTALDAFRLDGRTIVVTGGARGIGRGIAELLAGAGARIGILDIGDPAEALHSIAAAGGVAVAETADISDGPACRTAIDAIAQSLGGIDGLVNNAAIDSPVGTIDAIDQEDWERVIRVNLSGAFHCVAATLPYLRLGGRGSIVNISSEAAFVGRADVSPAYNASKAGLLGLTMSLAAQLATHKIRVNAITPGLVLTPETEGSGEVAASVGRYPLGVGAPADIAYLVLYLVSDAARWMSGTVIRIHGASRGGHDG